MSKDITIVIGGYVLLCLLAPTLVEVFMFITEYVALLLAAGFALVALFFIVKRIRRA